METQTPAITTPVMKQILTSSYVPTDFWLDKFGTPLYICNVFKRNDMMLFDFEHFFDLFFSDFGHARLFLRLFLSTTILLSLRQLINSSFCDSSLFSSVLFALFPMPSLRCRLGCSLLLLRFVSKTLRAFWDMWWNTETASRLQSLWRIFCRWNLLAINKREGLRAQINWEFLC